MSLSISERIAEQLRLVQLEADKRARKSGSPPSVSPPPDTRKMFTREEMAKAFLLDRVYDDDGVDGHENDMPAAECASRVRDIMLRESPDEYIICDTRPENGCCVQLAGCAGNESANGGYSVFHKRPPDENTVSRESTDDGHGTIPWGSPTLGESAPGVNGMPPAAEPTKWGMGLDTPARQGTAARVENEDEEVKKIELSDVQRQMFAAMRMHRNNRDLNLP